MGGGGARALGEMVVVVVVMQIFLEVVGDLGGWQHSSSQRWGPNCQASFGVSLERWPLQSELSWVSEPGLCYPSLSEPYRDSP